jgi:lipoyl-dependent peroxiredoxin
MSDYKLLYTAKARTTGGRDGGASHTDDGRLDVKLSLPGSHGTGTNPEQLLAVGWSACFLSAVKIAAAKAKIHLPDTAAIDSEIDLNNGDSGYFLKARLKVSLPGIDRETGESLVNEGQQLCPYSKAMHGKIEIEYNLV